MRSLTAAVLGLVVLVGATACDYLDEEFNAAVEEVKKEKGLDLTDPGEVMIANMVASGEDAEKLAAAKSFQRVSNEQKGDDKIFNAKDYAGARESYQRALRWTSSDDKRNQAAIREKVADTWLSQSAAARDGSDASLQKGVRSAASDYGELAEQATDPKQKARLFTKQGLAKINGREGGYCASLSNAAALDPANQTIQSYLGIYCSP